MKVKLKLFILDYLEILIFFLKKENIIKLFYKEIKYLIYDFCFVLILFFNGFIILLCLILMKNLGERMGICLI